MARKPDYIEMINDKYTIGVEEEYMICDPSSGKLINLADNIMK